ncbi:MAG: glycosyltransferase [Akkermansiaceae bacterium]|nr:glycosyltransferase [Verrucomicrobiales bacterium]
MQPAFDAPVNVFIVHWNRPEECLKTIEAFLDQGVPMKISIVDNASQEERFQFLKERIPSGIELLRLAENRGWGGGVNVLLKSWLAAQGSSFCFVTAHDALPVAGCLRQLLEAMKANPRLGIVCPEYGKPELPTFSPIHGARLVPIPSRTNGTVELVAFAHGTLMLFRRECLEQIGLFDERYFAYGDETEIGLRARKHRWDVAVAWGAVVINPGSWTPTPLLGYLWARSSLLMARTYGGWSSVIIRASLMLARNVVLSFSPASRRTLSSPTARLLAIRDFLLNRFGSPSPELLARFRRTAG